MDVSLIITAITGLLVGTGHVFSGPDHLAAVAPLAVDQPTTTWRVGLVWGIGHSAGVWVLALLALLIRDVLPIDWLSSWGERFVGLVLIAIGVWGLRKLLAARLHAHWHEHEGLGHVHVHAHKVITPGHGLAERHDHTHSAMGIGALHGLAGTAHLVGVLPALGLPTRLHAAVYVFTFGLGSIGAMALFSWLTGLLAQRLEHRGNQLYRYLLAGCSCAAIAVGCYWCYTTMSAIRTPG